MPASYIQILGGGSCDGGNGILLFFDERRYLFNCSEGTQRFCGEHGIKLNRLHSVFLSRLEWERSGGLPGMICTIADAGGIERLQVVGPPNTSHFVATLRPFLRRSTFALDLVEKSEQVDQFELVHQDNYVKVSALELFASPLEDTASSSPACKRTKSPPEDGIGEEKYSNRSLIDIISGEAQLNYSLIKKTNKSSESYPNYSFVQKMFLDLEIKSSDDHLRDHQRMPSVSRRSSSLCYLVEGAETPGKFDAQRAKALGVPVGPLNGLLAKGETVTLSDGSQVEPRQVVGLPTKGAIFILLDLFCLSQIEGLKRHVSVLTALKGRTNMIIYLCGKEIFESKELQEIKDIFSEAQHVLIEQNSKDPSPILYQSAAEILQTLHNNVDKNIFKIPYGGPQTTSLSLTKYNWNPPGRKDFVDADECNTLKEKSAAFPQGSSSCPREPFTKADDPMVTFLGTGAALPGKYRNVSSTLVDFGDSAYLFDCGEATYGQIVRSFGPTEASKILDRLKGILISHLHADHQLGVPGILRFLNHVNIVAPSRYRIFLEELAECANLHGSFTLHDSERINEDADYQKMASEALSLDQIDVVPVIHCPHSYGFVIKHLSGIRLVYSGDTRPCQRLVEAGHQSDILIHEASFCDQLQAEAIDKRHSTVSEAIGIGQQMQAKYILLSHISQRYAKSLPPHDWSQHDNVFPAIDLTCLRLSLLHSASLPHIVSKMRLHLPDPEDDRNESDKV